MNSGTGPNSLRPGFNGQSPRANMGWSLNRRRSPSTLRHSKYLQAQFNNTEVLLRTPRRNTMCNPSQASQAGVPPEANAAWQLCHCRPTSNRRHDPFVVVFEKGRLLPETRRRSARRRGDLPAVRAGPVAAVTGRRPPARPPCRLWRTPLQSRSPEGHRQLRSGRALWEARAPRSACRVQNLLRPGSFAGTR